MLSRASLFQPMQHSAHRHSPQPTVPEGEKTLLSTQTPNSSKFDYPGKWK